MVLNTPEGNQWVATSADSVFLFFDNDLLDGFYHDLGDTFMFISAHSPSYKWILEASLEEGGYSDIQLEKDEYTLEDTQVASIIQGVAKMMIYSLEKELREAA